MANRRQSAKRLDGRFSWKEAGWTVKSGKLVPAPGRPSKETRLFEMVAEKLPYECLFELSKFVGRVFGVYICHDSMGVARYGGRGDIFDRLKHHHKDYYYQLLYFSFYVIKIKAHEREVETIILRAAASQMTLNDRKIAAWLHPGNIGDYEPGTEFFERGGNL